jgi:STE24 endopeptidase
MTATRVAKRPTLVVLAAGAAVLVLVAGWALAAWLLTRTTIPGNLHEPHVAVGAEFPAKLLHRSARYDGVLRWLWVAGTVVTLAALVLFAWLGPRLARAWQLGRVGTGIMVGTVTTLGTWAVALPIGAIALWWGRRYHLEQQDYVSWTLEQWPSLVSQVVGLTIALTILLLLAGRFGRRWWLVAAPLFTVLGALLVLVLPYVETIGTRPPHHTAVNARIRELAREEGVGSTPIRIQTVSDRTTAANAFTTGIGPSARVFVWDTFFDGRFTNREIELVVAHEFGHVAHRHIWKGLAWSLLLTAPAFLLVELATRRRGGLERPEVVPFALLVLALIGLVITPFGNAVSRRYEAEADWAALRATRDPAAAESLFRKFTRYDLVQPNPPLWSYVLLDDHPTVVQRIALARAYRERAR